jgi:glyoxylase-like metal-dependent hydrolase (beta-lactamase superfamily II)
MAAKLIVEGLWQIRLGAVNAFLIDSGELTLIDSGFPDNAGKIVQAVESLGRKSADIRHIIATHCHPDHTGSLAAIKRLTGAPVYMHATDAAMVRKGESRRPMTAAPGLLRSLLYNVFVAHSSGTIEPCAIDHEIPDGIELPIAGGLRAVHAPGHCAGQLALLWPIRRVLFVADAASNMPTFGLSVGYENLAEGLRSLAKIAALDFDIACFGHGSAITTQASARFKHKWGSPYFSPPSSSK